MRKNWFWLVSLFIHVILIGYISLSMERSLEVNEPKQSVNIDVESSNLREESKLKKVLKKTSKVEKSKVLAKEKTKVFAGDIEQTYLDYLNSTIDRNKSYPLKAKRLGDEGRVVLFLTIEKEGHIKNLFIRNSSNSKILDQASVNLVKKSAPFKALPEGMDHIDVDVPIDWSL